MYDLQKKKIMRRRTEEEYKKYENLGSDIGKLVAEKQEAYGDAFGKSGNVLRILFPNGVEPSQYTDLLTVARMLDKLFRIATDKDAFGEDPFSDIVGYGLLAMARRKEKE